MVSCRGHKQAAGGAGADPDVVRSGPKLVIDIKLKF